MIAAPQVIPRDRRILAIPPNTTIIKIKKDSSVGKALGSAMLI